MTSAHLRRALFLALPVVTACASPEAVRIRGGGPGADMGNRRAIVWLHAGAKPYYKTPCVTEPVACTGPLPVFRPAPTVD